MLESLRHRDVRPASPIEALAIYLPATPPVSRRLPFVGRGGTPGEANADDVSLIGELHDVSSRFGATPYVHEFLGSDET
jgi:hypothetical protein